MAGRVLQTGAGRQSAQRLAVLLMAGALFSKVLGLVREVLVAHAIGASMIADSFRGGFTAIFLPIGFLQSETVPAILIPTYRAWYATGEAARRFAGLSVALTLLAALLFLGVEAAAPAWIDILLGGFSEAARSMTLRFTRIMALAMPASVLLGCLSAAEIAQGRSRLTSARASVVNVAVIAGVSLLLTTGNAEALAWSFAAAFNGLAVWGLWLLLRDGSLDVSAMSVRSIWAGGAAFFVRLRPMALQPVAEYAAIWIERLLASGLLIGSLASLDYARTITDCAVLLVSQPIGLAVLSAGPSRDIRAQMDALTRPALAFAIPGSIFLVLFAPELVELVFRRGAFDGTAVMLTSQALRGIAAGMWAMTLGWILLRILNSAGRNARATMIMAAAFGANALTSALLAPRLGELGLGLGEAVRGVVLLAGVAMALGGAGQLVRLLLLASPCAACLLAGECLVRAQVIGVLPRLLSGATLAAAASVLLVYLLVPVGRERIQLGLRAPLQRIR